MKTYRYILIVAIALLAVACKNRPNNRAPKLFNFTKGNTEIRSDDMFTTDEEYDDSNVKLNLELQELVLNNPSTLDYDFKELIEDGDVNVLTSDDGNLRFYFWDKCSQNLPYWMNIYQYRSNDGKVHAYAKPISVIGANDNDIDEIAYDEDKDDDSSHLGLCILDIYTHKAANGDTYYLIRHDTRVDGGSAYAGMKAMTIRDDELVLVPFFERNGELVCELASVYACWDWLDRTGEEGSDWIYRFDREKSLIYEPIVYNQYTCIDRYRIFSLKDGKCVYLGDDSGHWLHPSIRDFEQLEFIFCTKDYKIRVDKMSNGAYRYASWKHNKSMSRKPDIIIENGLCKNEGTYSFSNDGYRYEIFDGNYNGSNWTLSVFHKGKRILYQEQAE